MRRQAINRVFSLGSVAFACIDDDFEPDHDELDDVSNDDDDGSGELDDASDGGASAARSKGKRGKGSVVAARRKPSKTSLLVRGRARPGSNALGNKQFLSSSSSDDDDANNNNNNSSTVDKNSSSNNNVDKKPRDMIEKVGFEEDNNKDNKDNNKDNTDNKDDEDFKDNLNNVNIKQQDNDDNEDEKQQKPKEIEEFDVKEESKEDNNKEVSDEAAADAEAKAKVDVDALWAELNEEDDGVDKPLDNAALSGAVVEDEAKKPTTQVTHTFDFAGETVTVTQEVAVDELRKRKNKSTGLEGVVSGLTKKKKLSAIAKSHLDWESYKSEHGLQAELEQHAKDGYLEKEAFLERADWRQFAKEREVRDVERRRRAATEQQQQKP